MVSRIRLAFALLTLAPVFAAEPVPAPPTLPPLPSELPVLTPSPAANLPAIPQTENALRRPRISVTRPPNTFPGFSGTNRLQSVATVRPAYQPPTLGDDVISWDAITKEYNAKPGETAANFTFALTNVSKTNVVINWVRPSCGCTVAKLPPTPWTLASGETGNIELTVDLRGKFGTLSKYVSVDSSAGQKLLNLKIVIPANTAGAADGMDARARNMQMAMADRQAVFRGDCARCHAVPTVGKTGEALYQAGCAICHDAPHRATMVPDLHALKNATGKDYWAHWITNGKPGSLMPSFAIAQGGPLTEQQIQSLAEFLDQNFPKHPAASGTAAVVPPAPATTAKN